MAKFDLPSIIYIENFYINFIAHFKGDIFDVFNSLIGNLWDVTEPFFAKDFYKESKGNYWGDFSVIYFNIVALEALSSGLGPCCLFCN